MKKYFFTFLAAFLFAPFFANAQDKKVEEKTDCTKFQQIIKDGISDANTCWDNSECQAYNFGCPWEMVPCQFSVISTIDSDKVKIVEEQIKLYEKNCMPKDKKLKKHCEDMKKAAKGKVCHPPELLCLNGRCVTQTFVLMQNNDSTGVDIYGSKGVEWEDKKNGEEKAK